MAVDLDTWLRREQDRVRRVRARNRTAAELSVFSESIDADEISSLLDLQPDQLTRKGDFYAKGMGNPNMRSDATVWIASSAGKIKSHRTTEHLAWLLEVLFGKTPSIRQLQKLGASLRIVLECSVVSAGEFVFLEPDILRRLAQSGISFEVRFWKG